MENLTHKIHHVEPAKDRDQLESIGHVKNGVSHFFFKFFNGVEKTRDFSDIIGSVKFFGVLFHGYIARPKEKCLGYDLFIVDARHHHKHQRNDGHTFQSGIH